MGRVFHFQHHTNLHLIRTVNVQQIRCHLSIIIFPMKHRHSIILCLVALIISTWSDSFQSLKSFPKILMYGAVIVKPWTHWALGVPPVHTSTWERTKMSISRLWLLSKPEEELKYWQHLHWYKNVLCWTIIQMLYWLDVRRPDVQKIYGQMLTNWMPVFPVSYKCFHMHWCKALSINQKPTRSGSQQLLLDQHSPQWFLRIYWPSSRA